MDPLPTFLLLLKSNVLLFSIITNNSFTQLDLSKTEHIKYTNQYIKLLNFQLDKHLFFSSVDIILPAEGAVLTFHTSDSTYYKNPEKYFHRPGLERIASPYQLFGQTAQTNRKSLGEFLLFNPPVPPASISLMHSSMYGYTIVVTFSKYGGQ